MPDPRLAKLPDLSPQMVPPVQRSVQPVSIQQPVHDWGALTVPMMGEGGVNPVQTMPHPATGSVPPIGQFAKK